MAKDVSDYAECGGVQPYVETGGITKAGNQSPIKKACRDREGIVQKLSSGTESKHDEVNSLKSLPSPVVLQVNKIHQKCAF